MALTTGGARRGPEQLLLSGIAAGRLSRTFGEASVAEQPSTLNGHRFMVIESDMLELMITGGNRGNGGVAAEGGVFGREAYGALAVYGGNTPPQKPG
jgi:hypothetical protein